jgi:predicted acetyltransferase
VAHLPLDDPLQWMLADPRRLRIVRVRDFLWLRLLAIENALTSRKYWATDELVLEITDTVLPTNSGRYRLATTGSNAWCERTRSPAELHLDVADLAAVYLGGATFNTLARAGLIQELSPGALTRADTVFSSAIKPWTVADW